MVAISPSPLPILLLFAGVCFSQSLVVKTPEQINHEVKSAFERFGVKMRSDLAKFGHKLNHDLGLEKLFKIKPKKFSKLSDSYKNISRKVDMMMIPTKLIEVKPIKVPIVEKKLPELLIPNKQEVSQSIKIRRVFSDMISQKNITHKSKLYSIDSWLRPIVITSNKKNDKNKTIQPPELLKSQKQVLGSLFNISAFLPFLNHSSKIKLNKTISSIKLFFPFSFHRQDPQFKKMNLELSEPELTVTSTKLNRRKRQFVGGVGLGGNGFGNGFGGGSFGGGGFGGGFRGNGFHSGFGGGFRGGNNFNNNNGGGGSFGQGNNFNNNNGGGSFGLGNNFNNNNGGGGSDNFNNNNVGGGFGGNNFNNNNGK